MIAIRKPSHRACLWQRESTVLNLTADAYRVHRPRARCCLQPISPQFSSKLQLVLVTVHAIERKQQHQRGQNGRNEFYSLVCATGWLQAKCKHVTGHSMIRDGNHALFLLAYRRTTKRNHRKKGNTQRTHPLAHQHTLQNIHSSNSNGGLYGKRRNTKPRTHTPTQNSHAHPHPHIHSQRYISSEPVMARMHKHANLKNREATIDNQPSSRRATCTTTLPELYRPDEKSREGCKSPLRGGTRQAGWPATFME